MSSPLKPEWCIEPLLQPPGGAPTHGGWPASSLWSRGNARPVLCTGVEAPRRVRLEGVAAAEAAHHFVTAEPRLAAPGTVAERGVGKKITTGGGK